MKYIITEKQELSLRRRMWELDEILKSVLHYSQQNQYKKFDEYLLEMSLTTAAIFCSNWECGDIDEIVLWVGENSYNEIKDYWDNKKKK